MSSGKHSTSAQSSVSERRLRPIYDWLDNGNSKKALQEAEKVLKKQPDFQCAKALLCLSLIRLGRECEAEQKTMSLLEESPTEESVLSVLSIVLRELQQPDKICQMYENATKKEPQNEELLSQLFMAYVRLGYYKKQQQAALQLYKTKPKNPYYFWAIMSIVLQVYSNQDDDKKSVEVMLPLAERMIAKHEKEGKLDQEQETHLYIMVLEMQHKYKEAIALLDGPLGAALEEKTSYIDFIAKKRLEYQKKLNMWPQVNILAKKLLNKNPDQWDFYVDYITSVFHAIDAISTEQEALYSSDEVDANVTEADNFFVHQQKENPKCRGPFLAEIELYCRQIARKETEGDAKILDKLLECLVQFFSSFGSKQICSSDLKLFLPTLDKERLKLFFDRALATISFEENGSPSSIADIQRHVCWHQLQRVLGMHAIMTKEEAHNLIEEMQKMYELCQSLVKSYTPTEQRPSDYYILMAAHLLWELWVDTKADEYFWKAIVLLEYALKLSPSNHQIKILMIKYYNQAGAVGSSQTVHNALDLKHIQLDTLGHLITRHMITCGHFATSSSVIAATLKFFTSNYKDIVDHIISAYRCGSFGKILEFIKLRDRLSASQHYTSLTVERILLDFLTEAAVQMQTAMMVSFSEINPDVDEIAWKDLIDNRDFKTAVSWEPPERSVTDDLISESFIIEQKFLRVRSLTLRAITAAIHLSEGENIHKVKEPPTSPGSHKNAPPCISSASAVTNGDGSKHIDYADVLRRLVEKFKELTKDCHQSVEKLGLETKDYYAKYPLQGPDRPRLVLHCRDGCIEFIIKLLELVLEVHSYCQSKQRATELDENPKFISSLQDICAMFSQMIEKQVDRLNQSSEQQIIKREEHLEALVNIVESSSFCCILLGSCQSLLSPIFKVTSGKKGKKRKELNQSMEKTLASFNACVQELSEYLSRIDSVIDSMSQVIELDKLSASLQHKFSQITLSSNENSSGVTDPAHALSMDSLQEHVAKGLDSSYHFTFWQLKGIVKKKKAYMVSLTL